MMMAIRDKEARGLGVESGALLDARDWWSVRF
jgi:hypothetical protein